ncbi:MAG: GrpB family protein [Bacillota bacterium]
MKTLNELSLSELWELFPINLKPYNPMYKRIYKQESSKIERLLSHLDVQRISHIGSTAIEGIESKPIIDILVELKDESKRDVIKKVLQNNKWILMKETLTPFNVSFNKGYTIDGYADSVFHLHLRKFGDCDAIYFRDYLNEHEDVRIRYEVLKKNLLKKYSKNRDAYTEGKTEFIHNVTKRAKQSYKYKYNLSHEK